MGIRNQNIKNNVVVTCFLKLTHRGTSHFFGVFQYIDDSLPAESPYLYGLHPNAEIGFLTQTSEKLFRTVLEMQPRDGGVGEGGGKTRDEKVKPSGVQRQHFV